MSSLLFPHTSSALLSFVLLVGCNRTAPPEPPTPPARSVTPTRPASQQDTLNRQLPQLPASAYAFINGVWEGTVGDPFGWKLRFDCFAQNGIQKVLASVTGPGYQSLFMHVNYGMKADTIRLWWNDEENRATMNLRLDSFQLVGTFEQAEKGGPVPVTLSKTSNAPYDGAARYHGAWEGKLGKPFDYDLLRFDVFSDNGLQKVLASIVAKGCDNLFWGVDGAVEDAANCS